MSLASRAMVEFELAHAKQVIEDAVLLSARNHKRFVEMPSLPCQNEHTKALVAWMESEGLKVEHRKWMDKPTGLGGGLCEDDELVEHSKYIISF